MAWTPVEAAVAFAVLTGSVCATAPACVRAVRLSYTAEASENLAKLSQAGAAKLTEKAPLASTPLTPAAVPRGEAVVDPEGTWDQPTFSALGFRIDDPHRYAYRVDVAPDPATPLRVVAHGDLDGDGVLSTFERTVGPEGDAFVPRPGLVVSSDLE